MAKNFCTKPVCAEEVFALIDEISVEKLNDVESTFSSARFQLSYV